jgi:hypothetical protein
MVGLGVFDGGRGRKNTSLGPPRSNARTRDGHCHVKPEFGYETGHGLTLRCPQIVGTVGMLSEPPNIRA